MSVKSDTPPVSRSLWASVQIKATAFRVSLSIGVKSLVMQQTK